MDRMKRSRLLLLQRSNDLCVLSAGVCGHVYLLPAENTTKEGPSLSNHTHPIILMRPGTHYLTHCVFWTVIETFWVYYGFKCSVGTGADDNAKSKAGIIEEKKVPEERNRKN